ncbi:MAG: flagellar protein FlaG [Pseudomonadota bacterium]
MAIEVTKQGVSNVNNNVTKPARVPNNQSSIEAENPVTSKEPTTQPSLINAERQQTVKVNEQKQNISDSIAEEVEKIQESVQQLNDSARQLNRDLEFSVDNDSGRTIITVKDRRTEEIIRQIPSEDVLKIANRVKELSDIPNAAQGVFINEQV